MVFKFLLIGVIVGCGLITSAQDSLCVNKKYITKNNLGIELGGTGLLYSIYYQRNFFSKKVSCQAVKIGINYLFREWSAPIWIPLEYNYYAGKNRYKLFGGLGVIGMFSPEPSPANYKDRQEYKRLDNISPDSANNKFNIDFYQPLFDIAYTAKVGLMYLGKKKLNFNIYYNCFYGRYNLKFHFQPWWVGIGLMYKI